MLYWPVQPGIVGAAGSRLSLNKAFLQQRRSGSFIVLIGGIKLNEVQVEWCFLVFRIEFLRHQHHVCL